MTTLANLTPDAASAAADFIAKVLIRTGPPQPRDDHGLDGRAHEAIAAIAAGEHMTPPPKVVPVRPEERVARWPVG